MTSNNKIKLETLCQSTVITLSADMSVTQALIHPAWRQFHDLPVVAEDGRFLGVLRYKTFRYLEETVLPRAESPMEATLDLGELLFQGFSGVFDSFWTAAKTFSSGEKVL
jgi:hypothetical protein